MKRCDLHIHTVPSVSDREFVFDRDIMKNYVEKTDLDVIAITNHNLFDYSQFCEIKSDLPNTVVLPGIEVDLETGHILVIGNNDDSSISDFIAKCSEVSNQIHTATDYISYDTFMGIFSDLSKFLLIPHYEKNPKLPNIIIEKFGDNIVAGEVSSVKKFLHLANDADELTPVIFSDFRVEKGIESADYPVNHTYLDIEEVNIRTLKLCLMDKTKVSLTSEKGVKLFPIFSNGQMLSTRLNVMFGKRSSGKTYTLNAIAKRFGDKAKYIKQFELLNTERNDSEQFENDLKVRQERYAENFFKEFSEVVADMLGTTSEVEDESKVQSYLDAVMTTATQSNLKDVYSKSFLFNESEFIEYKYDDLRKLIEAVRILLETQQYKELVNRHLTEDALKNLLKELIITYRTRCLESKYQKEVNNMLNLVKHSLQLKSAAPRIPNLDLYQYFVNKKKREVFTQIAMSIKKNRTISKEKVDSLLLIFQHELLRTQQI